MASVDLRPINTVFAGGWSPVGTATLDDATSDDSDATYADSTGVLNDPMRLVLGATTLTDERVRRVRQRARLRTDADPVQVSGTVVGYASATIATSAVAFEDAQSAWFTPPSEITQAILNSGLQWDWQQTSGSPSDVELAELYLELDVRARPVIDTASVTVDASGIPTYNLAFTYDTAGVPETVTARVTVTDGVNVVDTIERLVTATDPTAFPVQLESSVGSLAPETYTATFEVIASGYSAPSATYTSTLVEAEFTVNLVGVPDPVVSCELNEADQSVTVTVEQLAEAVITGDCLVVEGHDIAYVGGAITDEAVVASGTVLHAALWVDSVLVVAEFEIVGSTITVNADDVVPDSGTARLVVAYADPTSNTGIVTTVVDGSQQVNHSLNTTDLIVQAIGPNALQATIAVEVLSPDVIQVDQVPAPGTQVLILGPVTSDEECVVTETVVVPPGTDVVVSHQFAFGTLFATVIDDATSLVVWAGLHFEPFSVTLDNPTAGNLTLNLAGLPATFDDPDQVRVEMRRNPGNLLWPFDGQGQLAPPEQEVVLVDRFTPRCASTCDGQCGTPPTYRVRLYGLVNGLPATSSWVECSPGCITHDGLGWLRHPSNPELDFDGCVSTQPWVRQRAQSAGYPVDGGIPTVTTGDPGGRDYTLTLPQRTTPETLAAEATLNSRLLFYQPVDACMPGAWLAPAGRTVQDFPVPGRPHSISQPFLEVEPEPVVLPEVDGTGGGS